MSHLTFGVEYELKLRLTKAQLQTELSSSEDTRHLQIITNPGPVRLLNVGPQYLNNDYHNFALHDPSPSPSYPFKTILINKSTGKPSEYRGYHEEILRMIQKRLQSTPGHETTAIHQGITKQTDFSIARLHLTTDASLNGLSHTQKLSLGLSHQEAQETDFAGAEIVTAPHTSPADAAIEARVISTSLQDYICDDETAMHIHVGNPDGSAFDLPTLQNLAFISVIYESETSKLTIPSKRGQGFETLSNRLSFLNEHPEPTKRHVFACDERGNVTETTIVVVENYASISEIRKRIFEDVGKAVDPVAKLKHLMGTKGSLVNFTYCDREAPAARTVEFCQHYGSLEGEDVLHWARHCTLLVALAQRYAENGSTCGMAQGCWEEDVCIEELWRLMRLPEDSKTFFRRRMEELGRVYGTQGITPFWEVAVEEDFYGDDDGGAGPDMWDEVDEKP